MDKLDLKNGDTILSLNCREFQEYLDILKQKIMTNPLDAITYIHLMEAKIRNELK